MTAVDHAQKPAAEKRLGLDYRAFRQSPCCARATCVMLRPEKSCFGSWVEKVGLGAYTQSKERVNLKGTQRWRKARFLLDDARFEGRQNDQSDFRVTVVGARFFLRSVKVLNE